MIIRPTRLFMFDNSFLSLILHKYIFLNHSQCTAKTTWINSLAFQFNNVWQWRTLQTLFKFWISNYFYVRTVILETLILSRLTVPWIKKRFLHLSDTSFLIWSRRRPIILKRWLTFSHVSKTMESSFLLPKFPKHK